MRIGTWNLDGRHSQAHIDFVAAHDCGVLLLTEVSERLQLDGYKMTSSRDAQPMTADKRWAAIAARGELTELDAPHPASVAAIVDGTTFVPSILPWRGSGGSFPWEGADHAQQMKAALTHVHRWIADRGPRVPLVWGGDWNQSLAGREQEGSRAGREALIQALGELQLAAATAALAHHLSSPLTTDHIAVRVGVQRAGRVVAVSSNGQRLSDHDLYVVDV